MIDAERAGLIRDKAIAQYSLENEIKDWANFELSEMITKAALDRKSSLEIYVEPEWTEYLFNILKNLGYTVTITYAKDFGGCDDHLGIGW